MNARPDLEILAGPTLGGIDLVAIERVRNGQSAELTDTELEYLWTTCDGSDEQARPIAAALGMTRSNVQKRCAAAKKRAAQRT